MSTSMYSMPRTSIDESNQQNNANNLVSIRWSSQPHDSKKNIYILVTAGYSLKARKDTYEKFHKYEGVRSTNQNEFIIIGYVEYHEIVSELQVAACNGKDRKELEYKLTNELANQLYYSLIDNSKWDSSTPINIISKSAGAAVMMLLGTKLRNIQVMALQAPAHVEIKDALLCEFVKIAWCKDDQKIAYENFEEIYRTILEAKEIYCDVSACTYETGGHDFKDDFIFTTIRDLILE